MMYPKTKILTEEEYLKLKEADIKRRSAPLNKFNYISHGLNRRNFYANDRKKIQRVLNHYVKQCNKNIERDYLWRGRFFIRQIGYPAYYKFEDNSGGELYVTLRFYDKLTLKYVDVYASASDFCFGLNSIFILMNNAIIEHFKAWEVDKKDKNYPNNDRIDYKSIPSDWIVKNASSLYELF